MAKFGGVYAPIITPFKSDYSLDEDGLRAHVRFVLDGGVSGVMPCGDTGEWAYMTFEERLRVYEIVADELRGRAQFIPGIADVWTGRAVEAAKYVKQLGADAIIFETPAHFPLSDDEILGFHEAVAEVGLPIMLHNAPGVSHVDLTPSLVAKLAEKLPNVRSIKEASDFIRRVPEILRMTKGSVAVIQGSDDIAYYSYLLGAEGVASAACNIIPKECVELYRLTMKERDLARAKALNDKLLPVFILTERWGAKMFKFVLESWNRKAGPIRRPRLPLQDTQRDEVRRTLRQAGIPING